MPMSGKKDRDRFSIKFNLNDPLHETAVRLLEQQGPRRKAQFIANAVLHYVNCPETPESEFGPQVDYSYLETMVLEILKQQRLKEKIPAMIPALSTEQNEEVGKQNEVFAESAESDVERKGLTPLKDVDEMTRALIAETMMSFRNN